MNIRKKKIVSDTATTQEELSERIRETDREQPPGENGAVIKSRGGGGGGGDDKSVDTQWCCRNGKVQKSRDSSPGSKEEAITNLSIR